MSLEYKLKAILGLMADKIDIEKHYQAACLFRLVKGTWQGETQTYIEEQMTNEELAYVSEYLLDPEIHSIKEQIRKPQSPEEYYRDLYLGGTSHRADWEIVVRSLERFQHILLYELKRRGALDTIVLSEDTGYIEKPDGPRGNKRIVFNDFAVSNSLREARALADEAIYRLRVEEFLNRDQ